MPESIIDQTLLQQYRVDAFVASGGMGAVYRVWDLKRNAPLAMKVLHSDLADDPSVFKRFKREANALKRLTHPNIVPFYGLYETLDFAFLLEHFVDGPSLKDVLRQRKGKALSIDEALIYLKALCAALGYAHANGVVHCDVKPGNVMVDQGGRIYLTDFGIARHAESTTTTMAGAGTPAYMAPEQILGKLVTPATDIYSLGVLLFEMLAGQRPFRGTEDSTGKGGSTANERIRYGHLHLDPPDPQSLNPSIPASVSKVILNVLSKKPEERYHSTAAFFEAVCAAAGVQSVDVPSHATLTEEGSPKRDYRSGTVVVAPQPPPRGGPSSRPWLLGLGGGVVVLGFLGVIGVVSAVLLFGRGGLGDPPAPQALSPTQTRFVAQPPLPTYTSFPTYTPFPTLRSSATPRPASPTPRPTQPPVSREPTLLLNRNSFCRFEPTTGAGNVDAFLAGTSYPIVGRDSDDWWLVKIDRPDVTRRKACWISGEGNSVEGDISSVPYMEDFFVEPYYVPP